MVVPLGAMVLRVNVVRASVPTVMSVSCKGSERRGPLEARRETRRRSTLEAPVLQYSPDRGPMSRVLERSSCFCLMGVSRTRRLKCQSSCALGGDQKRQQDAEHARPSTCLVTERGLARHGLPKKRMAFQQLRIASYAVVHVTDA